MIFDFNIHLNIPGRFDEEGAMDISMLSESYRMHRDEFLKLQGANFMLFNTGLPFEDYPVADFVDEVRNDIPAAVFTQLLDFRRDDVPQAIERLVRAGVQGIKFHSYVQAITDSEIPAAVRAAREAAKRGMFIAIDASYGSTYLYEHDNMKLSAAIIREIKDVPIVILHSGGTKRWDAFLLTDGNKNVFLETSFTLPYYEGSQIEDDLAFIYRKMGIDRVLYASDFPAVTHSDSENCMKRFIKKYGFTDEESASIFTKNAEQLIAGLNVH